jgi:TolB-like protein/Tfp pilus assembly protein PilF
VPPFDRIGPYRVLERIGRGGMGEIFTAEDERLGRVVALKTILPALVPDEESRRRLLTEARAAAALAHPFICTIHDALEHEGVPVIVMEYVKGETVADRVTAGLVPAPEICRIATEVAEALAMAHARGTIHRDISAANIMLATDGHVKVMDFGLARAVQPEPASTATVTSSHLTGGIVVGTPPYLPPEALRAERIDARADLYSLGVVLYLMATGRLPFIEATTTALIAAILTRAPVAPRTLVPFLPPALDAIIMRLLEKSPDARYASATALAEALAGALSDTSRGPVLRSVAVLPFRTLGQAAADDDLGLGLADATITELAAVRSLLVRPTAAILRYRGRTVDPVHAGRELSVDAVVDGSLQRRGGHVRVTAQLLSTSDGRPLWGTKIDANIDDVFRLQDDVAREVMRALDVSVTAADERRLDRAPRGQQEAREHYLRGRVHLTRESIESIDAAIDQFQRALTIDPSYAQAYVGLASAFSRMAFSFKPESDFRARAEEMCARALAIDRALPEARFMRGWLAWTPAAGFQHETAIRDVGAAIAESPGLNEAHHLLGIVLLHVSLFEESARELERALAIDPNDSSAYMHLGWTRYLAGDVAEALEISSEAWRRSPSAWSGYQLALVQLQLGNVGEAEKTAAAAARHAPDDVLQFPLTGLIAALRGDDEAAERQIALTVQHKKAFGHYHHAQYDVACIYARLGRPGEAMQWLTDASRNGFPCHDFFMRDRLLEPLRGRTDFAGLITEVAAERDRCRRAYYESRESA